MRIVHTEWSDSMGGQEKRILRIAHTEWSDGMGGQEKRILRIAHTEWSDGMGGQEKRILAESVGLTTRGHHVVIVCRAHAALNQEATKASIPVVTLPLKSQFDLQSILKLRAYLKQENIDIVNTHSGKDSWIGGMAAKLAHVPVIVRTRHLNIPLRRNPLNFIHYVPDMYITCGEVMRKTLIEESGFEPQRLVSIPTGVPDAFFNVERNPRHKTKYGLTDDAVVISNVGILRTVKGQEVTLAAVKSVVRECPQARFLIVGDGPGRRRLETLTYDLGVTRFVTFTGFVEDVADVYSFTDVCVLSSHSEGVPQSVLQAMAASVPVVATSVGGVPEIIQNETHGLLVHDNDHEALARSIIRLIKNKALRDIISKNAREFVLRHHSLTHMLDATENLYENLLKAKQSIQE